MSNSQAAVAVKEISRHCKSDDYVDVNMEGNDAEGKLRYSLAVFSKDRKYRFYLRRVWDRKRPCITYVMLNPSTADAFKNDPTVGRCQERATKLGFGSFAVVNIFAYRSTQPNALTLKQIEPIGEGNDEWIRFAALEATKVMIGWGNHGKFNSRGDMVSALLDAEGIQLWCLGQNKGGAPIHPLYQAYATQLRRYFHSVL